jgi:hypothetical protein
MQSHIHKKIVENMFQSKYIYYFLSTKKKFTWIF